ncbi:MAG TPA: hypothetical protein DE316_10180 [Eubacterium sp.]|nr:hypothetical protein [Eubacterium sp.]HCH83430.1 hypothetical protein [Eubacterium sp.]
MILYKDRKHILRYIAIIFIAAVLILWIVCVVDVNRRFPKAEEELYSVGEWIEESGFEIKVNSLELISLEEASEKYGVNLQNDMKKIVPSTKYFILKMDVRNISDEELNIGKKLMSHTDLQVMPIGIVEVGEVLTNYTKNIKLQPGEEEEVVIKYILSNGVLREDRRWMLNKCKFYLAFLNYPVHKAVLFEDVKGL